MLDDRFNVEQAEYFLDRMFGERAGFVSMAFGHNPRTRKPRFAAGDFRTKHYAWPAERDQLIEDVDNLVNSRETRKENVEVFINPALRKSPSRKADTHAPLMWVWADMDHPPSQDQIDRINSLGAMSVLSGTEGHRHIYLPLDKPVTSLAHKALCRALRDAIGGDDKIAENDLLRLPGTLNWKTTSPRQVWLATVGRRAQNPSTVARKLCSMTGQEWSYYKELARDASDPDSDEVPADHPAPSRKQLSKKVRAAYDNRAKAGGEKYSRNQAIFELVSTAKEEGMSREDTHALVRTYPPAMEKWGTSWRISEDVDRIWQKAKGPEEVDAGFTVVEEDDGSDQPELMFHTLGSLISRVAAAPAPQYLFEGIISEGDYGIISAEDKAGKSLVMLDAAVSAASGTAWMGKFQCITPGPVILCLGEGTERKQVRRMLAIGRQKGLTEEEIAQLPIHILLDVPQVKDEDHIAELEEKIREVKPVLVEIDPFYLAASGVDFAKLSDVGQALKPIQAVCQRYNSALMLSHHWNKTGNGDSISRTSGVGLTAWGRFLIGIKIEKESMDPITRKTVVLQTWSVKGDEVMTEDFAVERTVWVDDPADLTSDMHYELTLAVDQSDVDRSKPLQYPSTMEKVSTILSENLDGLGIRAIIREIKESTGRAPAPKTITTCLDRLILHGYVVEGRGEGRGKVKPYMHVKTFTVATFNDENPGVKPAGPKPGRKEAGARDLDFASARSGPRRSR